MATVAGSSVLSCITRAVVVWILVATRRSRNGSRFATDSFSTMERAPAVAGVTASGRLAMLRLVLVTTVLRATGSSESVYGWLTIDAGAAWLPTALDGPSSGTPFGTAMV